MQTTAPRFREGDQVSPRPGTMTRFNADRARGVVLEVGTDGVTPILHVRWADGTTSSVSPDEVCLRESAMSNARRMIEQVLQGGEPSRVTSLQEAGANLPQMVNEWWNTIADTLHSFSKIKYSLETEFGETDPTVKSLLRSIGRLQQVANQESRDIIDAILTLRAKARQNPPHMPGHMTEDIAPEPTPMGPEPGSYPGALIPPNPEDPSFLYRTTFDTGCDGPHLHLCAVDAQGNGTTDAQMGSQHQILRYEVQPDAKDGHLHTLEKDLRQDVPTSLNPDGQDTSFHALVNDPDRFAY